MKSGLFPLLQIPRLSIDGDEASKERRHYPYEKLRPYMGGEDSLKESSYLLVGQFIVKIISFAYTIFLANSLGIVDFGLYIMALSYYSLIAAVADFGVTRYLTRELSLKYKDKGSLLSTAILTRLSVLSISFAVISLGVYILDPDKLRVALVSLAVLAVLPQSISLSFDAVYISSSRLKYSSFGIVSMTAITAAMGVILVKSQAGVVGVVVALMIGQLFLATLLIFFCFRHKISCLGVVNRQFIKQLAKGSLPYALLSIMGLVYFKIDTILLGYIRGSYEAGIYGAGYRFLEAIVFIPASFSVILFPKLTKMHLTNLPQLAVVKFRIIKLMGLMGVTFTLLYLTILPGVVKLILPQYSLSIDVVKILALSLPFMFIHVPLSQIILSSEKYLKQLILVSLLPLSFNIISNLTFLPQFGYIAAAWISVASDMISLMVLYFLTSKVIGR